jgi:hypothetical protein
MPNTTKCILFVSVMNGPLRCCMRGHLAAALPAASLVQPRGAHLAVVQVVRQRPARLAGQVVQLLGLAPDEARVLDVDLHRLLLVL